MAGRAPQLARAAAHGAEHIARGAGIIGIQRLLRVTIFSTFGRRLGTLGLVVMLHGVARAEQVPSRVFTTADGLAHNVVNKRSEMEDFLDAVHKNPSLWTTIVSPVTLVTSPAFFATTTWPESMAST